MQVDVDVPPKDAEPEEQMVHAPAYAPTTMGTRPVSAVLRRHSIDGSHGGGESGSVLVQQPEPQDEGEGEKEETEDGMSDVAPRSDAEGVVTDDLEFEEDLELLYPEQEVSQAGQEITPSASDSASRSISPVSPVPALSSARFPTAPAADGASTSTQLTVYPPGGQQLDGTDPGIASRFLQSCEGLGEEMHALRAEVAQLRAERAAPELQLEERVRRLEERSALAPPRPGLSGGTGRRWSHPLEHLMCANDSEMDVDARESPPGDGAVIMTKYGSVDGEPLPPRSRKFNGAPRFAAI
jgi:hypothetical protein